MCVYKYTCIELFKLKFSSYYIVAISSSLEGGRGDRLGKVYKYIDSNFIPLAWGK